MRVFTSLAVLLAYILLRVYILRKVFDQKSFVEILSQYRKLSHSADNTLFRILIHWTELYPILIPWPELYPILILEGLHPPPGCLARLYTAKSLYVYIEKSFCSKKICRNILTVPKTVAQCRKYPIPIVIRWTELYPILIHWPELYPILIHCRNIPYLNTWAGGPSRPWARVACYSLS